MTGAVAVVLGVFGTVVVGVIGSIIGGNVNAELPHLARRFVRWAATWYPESERRTFVDENCDFIDGYEADGRNLRALAVGAGEWGRALSARGAPAWLASERQQMPVRLKRLFDLAVSTVVVVAMLPVVGVAAVAVRMSSHGPVFVGQERVGQGGKRIVVWRFRTVVTNYHPDEEWNGQARVTTVGKWLRRSNMDELPLLFSIIRGDMSLVGPRPERPLLADHFSSRIPDYNDRHRKPVGLTGLAQVAALASETSLAEQVKYDNLYIDQWSFRSDLKILALTVATVLRPGRAPDHPGTHPDSSDA